MRDIGPSLTAVVNLCTSIFKSFLKMIIFFSRDYMCVCVCVLSVLEENIKIIQRSIISLVLCFLDSYKSNVFKTLT